MNLGEAIATARRARGLTQKQFAEQLGITQAALSRYENDLRVPGESVLEELASGLGLRGCADWVERSPMSIDPVRLSREKALVGSAGSSTTRGCGRSSKDLSAHLLTVDFLRRAGRMEGTLAIGAHMRRRATARPTVWRRLEAQLNLHRLHCQQILDRLDLDADLTIPWFDPFDFEPTTAARLLRAEWRMPIGPVRNLTGWMEAAGCFVFESDFGTKRVDGLSQWAFTHPVVMINMRAPTDRKRLTLAHELGQLCLHSRGVPDDVEADATAFAAEFLMSAEVIRPQLRNLTTGRLHDLKRLWGVSMQALIERAYHLGALTAEKRTYLYKRFSALGWRTHEPVSDELPPELPCLVTNIGRELLDRGLEGARIGSSDLSGR